MTYPYSLPQNPFPSSPTPTLLDAKVLGGQRHKDAKQAVLNCIGELTNKVAQNKATDRDFRLITVIQDVGAGKTHLALHVKSMQTNIICSYVDLSTISPKNLQSLFAGLMSGFSDEYLADMKAAIVEMIKTRAMDNEKSAKKFFRPSLFGGKSFAEMATEILQGKRDPDIRALNELMIGEFDAYERFVIKKIIYNDFKKTSDVKSLEEMHAVLAAVARLNHKFLGKITLLEVDELDSNQDSIDFVKAVINAHLPSTIMMLITTPSFYDDIGKASASVFDRLEKANYKIELAGSSTFEEVSDIVLEYIRQNVKDVRFGSYGADIVNKLRVIFDEFQEFRNIRSMLNIMYQAMEAAGRHGATTITEEVFEETIRQAYPGLRVRGSIMNVPIAEFIRIRREYADSDKLENNLKDAVKSLVLFAHEQGAVTKPVHNDGLDVFNDANGSKVAVSVVVGKDHGKSIEKISQTSASAVDRFVVLTNAHTASSDAKMVVNMDKCKMIDLIYFNQKYKNEDIAENDSDRALMLAKSILIC